MTSGDGHEGVTGGSAPTDGGVRGEGGGVAGGSPSGELFLHNTVEYLREQLESRDLEIRALKLQYTSPAVRSVADRSFEQSHADLR